MSNNGKTSQSGHPQLLSFTLCLEERHLPPLTPPLPSHLPPRPHRRPPPPHPFPPHPPHTSPPLPYFFPQSSSWTLLLQPPLSPRAGSCRTRRGTLSTLLFL